MADEIITRAYALEKSLGFYFTGKPCKHGHVAIRKTVNGTCIVCHEITLTRYRLDNPERIRQTDYAHQRANPARHNEVTRQWRIRNLEEIRERDRKRYARYMVEDPDRQRSYRRNREARERNAPGSHTLEEINALFDEQRGKCAYCEIKLSSYTKHLDHIIALSRGGANDISNLQWTCATCNLKKHAKDHILFAKEMGFNLHKEP